MNVSIHIERLVLDGVNVPYAQRPLLQAALEAELARLVTEGGLTPSLQSGGVFAQQPGGSIQLSAGGEPVRLGQQIAQAVYGGIGQ